MKKEILKIIEDSAFQDTSIKIADLSNVTQLGKYVFADCYKLKTVKLNDNLKVIENGLFCDCQSLKKINLPENITKMGGYIFNNCSNLKEINIPITVPSIIVGINDNTF